MDGYIGDLVGAEGEEKLDQSPSPVETCMLEDQDRGQNGQWGEGFQAAARPQHAGPVCRKHESYMVSAGSSSLDTPQMQDCKLTVLKCNEKMNLDLEFCHSALLLSPYQHDRQSRPQEDGVCFPSAFIYICILE